MLLCLDILFESYLKFFFVVVENGKSQSQPNIYKRYQ